jgi:hypothetical protein
LTNGAKFVTPNNPRTDSATSVSPGYSFAITIAYNGIGGVAPYWARLRFYSGYGTDGSPKGTAKTDTADRDLDTYFGGSAPETLGFWARTNNPAPVSIIVGIQTSLATSYYLAPVTISTPLTWTQFSVPLPSPNDGTWDASYDSLDWTTVRTVDYYVYE